MSPAYENQALLRCHRTIGAGTLQKDDRNIRCSLYFSVAADKLDLYLTEKEARKIKYNFFTVSFTNQCKMDLTILTGLLDFVHLIFGLSPFPCFTRVSKGYFVL